MTRYLTEFEINEIIEELNIPYNFIQENTDHINNSIRSGILSQLKEVEIYDEIYDEFKYKIIQAFNRSMICPGSIIGADAADAICAQATQANLNTFHKSGAADNTGIDGYRDHLNLTKERGNKTASVHFKNKTMNIEEVDKLSLEFIGMYFTDFCKDLDVKHIDLNDPPYWYSESDIKSVFPINDKDTDGKRVIIRLNLDLFKLFIYKITPSSLVDIFNEKTKGVLKLATDSAIVTLIPSPVVNCTIDVFITGNSIKEDYLINNIYFENIFSKVILKGVEGIKTFYVVPKKVNSLVRHYDKKNGHVYLHKVKARTSCIPLWRLENLMEKLGANILNKTDKYNVNMLTYSPTLREEIISMKIKGTLRTNFRAVENFGSKITEFSNGTYNITFNPSFMNRESIQINCEEILSIGFRSGYSIIDKEKLKESYSDIIRYNITVDDPDVFSEELTKSKDEYVYAEVIGNDLQALFDIDIVDKNKTYSNHFHNIKDILGINALRNYLNMSLFNMISSSGSTVHPSLIQLINDTLTVKGMNPMTSNGVSGQNRGGISQASIDKTTVFLKKQIFHGKKESASFISTSIICGKKPVIGTGIVSVISDGNIKRSNEDVIKYTNDINPIGVTSSSVYPRIIKPIGFVSYNRPDWFMSLISTKNANWYLRYGLSNSENKQSRIIKDITFIDYSNVIG